MAQQFFKIDLQKPAFPMLSKQQTRTRIGSGQRSQSVDTQDEVGISYCHNVMPTEYGYNAVGMNLTVAGITPSGTMIDVREIFSLDRSPFYLGMDDVGRLYTRLVGSSSSWRALADTFPIVSGLYPTFDSKDCTVATVNGISYIMFSTLDRFLVMNYNQATHIMTAPTLSTITLSATRGLVSANGYLIAYGTSAVAWSSTIDPTDFAPSDVTGAGGGNIPDIKGAIQFCVTNSLGFLIYAQGNIVAATYTGNVLYPFKFREVKGSEGGVSINQTSFGANEEFQFAYTKAGLQTIISSKAETILPEITDFLSGDIFEDYDSATNTFTESDVSPNVLQKRLTYISSRYLVLSYGIGTTTATRFSYALILDTSLNKLGKIKVAHTGCAEMQRSTVDAANNCVAFIAANGDINTVDFTGDNMTDSVLMLGKLEQTYSRLITVQELEVENVPTGKEITVSDRVALDGVNPVDTPLVEYSRAGNLRTYKMLLTGKNHTFTFEGEFNLVTALLKYTLAGRS